MYLVIAESAFDADCEVYKKHFAKSIGNEMKDEKIPVVQMMMAKLCAKVPKAYSKSTDAIAEMLSKSCSSEVT